MSERNMYRWRRMTEGERTETLELRREQRIPWHAPPHYESDSGCYLITAACYEHRPHIDRCPGRMAEFEVSLLKALHEQAAQVHAWIVLPNHYHALIKTKQIKALLQQVGQLHGSTSFQWNGEDNARGRKTWFNATETVMKSERHFWASFLYVLHNAVKHGYVTQWVEWPYSNAQQVLEEYGRKKVYELWQEYPLEEYGAKWETPEL